MAQKTAPNQVPLYDGAPISYSKDPVVLSQKDAQKIEASLEGLLKDVETFTSQALQKSEVLQGLGLPPDLDPTPTPLGLHIPFCRFDFLYDKGNLEVLELNTDGTSGFNIMEWLGSVSGIKKEEDPNHGLSQRLLAAIKAHTQSESQIHLLDFEDVKTRWEQKNLIENWGEGRLATPRVRTWKPNDIIYRRALSWQLRAKKEEVKVFLEDWSQKKINVVGTWTSDIGMSKAWPVFLKSELVPETLLVDDREVDRLKKEKDDWVIKGALSYSGKSVVRGKDWSQTRWEIALDQAKSESAYKRPWIAQRAQKIPLYEGRPLELGLYLLNGKSAGYMARWGHNDVISDTSKEVLRPIKILL